MLLQIQTRTSDKTDTNFTYFEVVGDDDRQEVTKERYEEIELDWYAWDVWQTLSASEKHASRTDDDGDGQEDEDPIDKRDNDGDGLIDFPEDPEDPDNDPFLLPSIIT